MFKSFAAALATVAVASHEAEFMQHIAEYGLSYGTRAEFEFRFERFIEAATQIAELNATETSVHGHNQFSTWTHAEYKRMLGRVEGLNYFEEEAAPAQNATCSSMDWRDHGAVTPVKDQGQCGSCWTFSSTGALEGMNFLATGKLLSLSEQQLVDCASSAHGYFNFGCNGGMQNRAFNYVKKTPLALESDYPYKAVDQDCAYAGNGVVSLSSYVMVEKNNADAMKAALCQQPLAVSIEADKFIFQSYKSGVLTSATCGTNLDHAVLAVGFGNENGQDYWLVKNSWNTTWGDEGYIKLGMDDSTGACGVQMGPLYPVA